jgi:hypothetical protein
VIVPYVLALVLLVYCVLDLLRTPSTLVRTLPKPVWFLLLLAPVFGPAAWLLAGRPVKGTPRPAGPVPGSGAPDDDEDFLRELRKQAEDKRRRSRDPRDDGV